MGTETKVGRDADSAPRLEVRGLSKRFGSAAALRKFDLVVRAGEIHGLVGRNGSGKSTLIKILAGYHVPDEVEALSVDGRSLRSGEASMSEIGFVHQDLALIPELSILENMQVGRWKRSRFGLIEWRRARAKVSNDLTAVGLELDLSRRVSSLGMGERALVAIARALGDVRQFSGRGLLVLDEPTVALTAAEVGVLFGALRRIAASGTSVLFVSHRLAEVLEITDRITVIRDGQKIREFEAEKSTEDDIVDAILGRRLSEFYPARSRTRDDVVLRVDDLGSKHVDSVSFDLHAGEIVGLAGLAGTGHEHVPYLLSGVDPADRGRLVLGGRSYSLAELDPASAIVRGIVLVPADRQRFGVVPSFSIAENVTLPILSTIARYRWIAQRRVRSLAEEVIVRYGVVPPSPDTKVSSLSGGNQQKVVLAKWLQRSPSVVIMHEPTQGIDVGAKRDIFGEVEQVAQAGAGILICSNEYEDLAHLCHRVLVFGHGRIMGELAGEMSGDRIAEECYRASGGSLSPIP